MTSHTMQASSKQLFVLLLATLTLLAGCASGPPRLKQMSQVEVRQLQSREFAKVTELDAQKAVIAALQDEGYIIATVDKDLGLVSASKEVTDIDRGTRLFFGSNMTYQTAIRYESSTSIRTVGDKVKIRINIVAKAVTNSGGMNWSQPVQDPKTYQSIFSKIDKSLFIGKHGI